MSISVMPGERPDRLEEACAVFGVFAPGEDVARLTCFGLQALQHRGQESAGIAVGDGETVMVYKDLGLVTQVFNENALSALRGNVAVGHCRYATAGGGGWECSQPHISAIDDVLIALAHNGTLVNTGAVRARLVGDGVDLRSNTDSEVAAKVIGQETKRTHHLRDGIRSMMQILEGAYAMVVATPVSLYAFRDPNGIRPLCIGKLANGGWVVASETCGLDIVGAEYVRDVEPGEIVRFSADGMHSEQGVPAGKRASCIFEYVYFARPDSVLDGQGVYQSRRDMGRILAQEAPVDADLVMGVPDSGLPAASGYAAESGIPYADGIVKNRYVGRSFIQPTQAMRQNAIRIKLNPLPSVIAGKRLIVIDDSIVRGNTSKKLVAMLKEAGAAEVHLRIVSPEVMWPCFYGIDTDTQDQLIAANMTNEQMCEFIGCDSLAFISLQGLHSAIHANHPGFCDACFSGDYVTDIPAPLQEKGFFEKNRRKFSSIS
ncbi:amidophosphoribosyltransferase [Denitrobacterium detoxificans]|uniref:Amidophosphoribosyltransferase n=1 Tax=Denitrobacterium detoxificans TaxID=79604 RepID=A0A172RWS7_9ACTN|nr:amidophosphoribosyltransferase [Denitrobacterium detoxificans]ANE22176.1 amidophosphoribosyltransferase [Denitrobacterium detoxificans]SEO83316.1 amidophosphoribosyltransferase [Denitrobacterium detoxificans]